MDKKFEKITLYVAHDEGGPDGLDVVLENILEMESYSVFILGWEKSEMLLVDKEKEELLVAQG